MENACPKGTTVKSNFLYAVSGSRFLNEFLYKTVMNDISFRCPAIWQNDVFLLYDFKSISFFEIDNQINNAYNIFITYVRFMENLK